MVSIQWTKGHHLGVVDGSGEIIKQIAGYKGFFVGDLGNVYSAWVKGVRPLRADYSALWQKKQFHIDRKRKCPYLHVSLQYNRKSTVYSVHRLVGLHFVKNPKPGIYNVVHHRAYPSNAAMDLEWTTQAHNTDIGKKTLNHRLVDPNGVIIEVHNLARWCRENNLHTSAFYNNRHCKGYKYLGSI